MKDLLKSDKLLKTAFLIGLAAIILIFMSGLGGKSKSESDSAETLLEERLCAMLCSMDGLEDTSKPSVMIKLDKDGLTVLGVTIVCEASDNPIIKEKMLEAVSKALDVSLSEICITA